MIVFLHFQMSQDYKCGVSCWHPKWMQRFATSRSFIVVFGLLGTIQAMSYVYFVVTLTTIEKRFKIPTSTFGKLSTFPFKFFLKLYALFFRYNPQRQRNFPNPPVVDTLLPWRTPESTAVDCVGCFLLCPVMFHPCNATFYLWRRGRCTQVDYGICNN